MRLPVNMQANSYQFISSNRGRPLQTVFGMFVFQQVVLFWDGVEPSGHRTWLVEAGH